MIENASLENTENRSSPSASTITDTRRNTPFPPGLVGDIAAYLHDSAPRPIPEIAIAGALGITSAIAGRGHSINGSGLNLYLMSVAPAGSGKGAIAVGINHLVRSVSIAYQDSGPRSPNILEFIGPSVIDSGSTLHRYLFEKSRSFLSVFNGGNTPMDSTGESGNDLRRVILDLFDRSGPNQILHAIPHVVPQTSLHDSLAEKNLIETTIVKPNFSMICQFRPRQFDEALAQDIKGMNLISRCVVIEYDGPRVAANRDHHLVSPKTEMIDQLGKLAIQSTFLNMHNENIEIEIEPEAKDLMNAFDTECDMNLNNIMTATGSRDACYDNSMCLWKHAYLKALRVAGVIACGQKYVNNGPLVTREIADWSIDLVKSDIESMIKWRDISISSDHSSK